MAYENVDNLDSLRLIVEELGRRISTPEDDLPTYNKSLDMGYPHIEHDSRGFHYVIVERGKEQSRVTTKDVDELLYLIFQDVTFNLAMAYELKNRVKDRDSRRLLFQHQLRLLGQLEASWRVQRENQLRDIIKEHPFDDNSGNRLDLLADLKLNGTPHDFAWEKACETYPLPAHKLGTQRPNED